MKKEIKVMQKDNGISNKVCNRKYEIRPMAVIVMGSISLFTFLVIHFAKGNMIYFFLIFFICLLSIPRDYSGGGSGGNCG